jgi:hypothetical protein
MFKTFRFSIIISSLLFSEISFAGKKQRGAPKPRPAPKQTNQATADRGDGVHKSTETPKYKDTTPKATLYTGEIENILTDPSDYFKDVAYGLKMELMRLRKCYIVLARIRPEEDPEYEGILEDIKKETIVVLRKNKVVDACINLLERASLSPGSPKDTNRIHNGQLANAGFAEYSWEVNSGDFVALNVFKNLHDVHKSWVTNIIIDGNSSYREPTESALRNNLALFSEDHDQWDMLSGAKYYGGVRTKGMPGGDDNFSYPLSFNYSGYFVQNENKTRINNAHKWSIDSHWSSLPYNVAEYLVRLKENGNKKELRIQKSNLMDDEGELQLNTQKADEGRSDFWGRVALPIAENPLSMFNGVLERADGTTNENSIPLMGSERGPNNVGSIALVESLGTAEVGTEAISWNKEVVPEQCVPQQLERGFLTGVKTMPGKNQCVFDATESLPRTRALWSRRDVNSFYDFYEHGGGGLLGSISYIVQNHDLISLQSMVHAQSHVYNGRSFARVWATNVIKDFLCRSTPIINPGVDSSILHGIDPGGKNSLPTHTYRGDGTCMSCHSTIDNMGSVLRNMVVGSLNDSEDTVKVNRWLPTSYDDALKSKDTFNSYETVGESFENPSNGDVNHGSSQGHQYSSSPSIMWSVRNPSPSDSNERLKQFKFIKDHEKKLYPNDGDKLLDFEKYWPTIAPVGRLIMHDVNGNRWYTNVNGLEQLGEKLMNTPDYHACYVKRYFKFLTNQDIPVFADFDIESGILNPYRYGGLLSVTELEKWEDIKLWGNQLLHKQIDLKGVFRKIIGSDYFMESFKGIAKGLLEPAEIISIEDEDPAVIIGNNCSGCHDGIVGYMESGGDKDLNPFSSNKKAYLVPGEPCSSLIYKNLNPENLLSANGENQSSCNHFETDEHGYMPQGGALNKAEMYSIKNWIKSMESN